MANSLVTQGNPTIFKSIEWWAMRDSNSRHPRCKRGALPTELIAPSRCEAMSAASVGVIYAQPAKTARAFARFFPIFLWRVAGGRSRRRHLWTNQSVRGGQVSGAICRCIVCCSVRGARAARAIGVAAIRGAGRACCGHGRFSPCGSKIAPSWICLQTRLTPKCEPLS